MKKTNEDLIKSQVPMTKDLSVKTQLTKNTHNRKFNLITSGDSARYLEVLKSRKDDLTKVRRPARIISLEASSPSLPFEGLNKSTPTVQNPDCSCGRGFELPNLEYEEECLKIFKVENQHNIRPKVKNSAASENSQMSDKDVFESHDVLQRQGFNLESIYEQIEEKDLLEGLGRTYSKEKAIKNLMELKNKMMGNIVRKKYLAHNQIHEFSHNHHEFVS
jgi:hypothetical protein